METRPERFVYFIFAPRLGLIKIGLAGDVDARLRNLQIATGDSLYLLGSLAGESAVEKTLHRRFKADRIRGEWFLPSADLLAIVGMTPTALRTYMTDPTSVFTFTGVNGKPQVCCPICHSEYVFPDLPLWVCGSNGIDDAAEWITRCKDWVDSATAVVPFWCQESDHRFALQFGGHKGYTFFRIVLPPDAQDPSRLVAEWDRDKETAP